MRNLKLQIEYDGANYAGWQVQGSRKSSVVSRQPKTIQGTIEKTLQKVLQEKIRLIASGRTDAGVHALAQVANFKTHSTIPVEKLQRALNGLLPDDITISKIEEAPLGFHSRFSAKGKIYRYIILNQKSPSAILRNRAYFYPYPLNIKLMQQEIKALLGRHNFKAFCASGSSVKDTVRTIKNLRIKKLSYPLSLPCPASPAGGRQAGAIRYLLIFIDIESDGFLYNMVRNIVGTLLEVGKGKFPKGRLEKVLVSGNRKLAGPTAPAKGLTLINVKY